MRVKFVDEPCCSNTPPSRIKWTTVRNEDANSSSSDSLVEIKLNEYVKRSEFATLDIRALVIRCSSCGTKINRQRKKVKKHRKLGIIQCNECYEFYGSSEFSQDESGYNYCTCCGNGGNLIICDFCPNGFCSACIRRNFGHAEISAIKKKDGWKCYCCDNTSLKRKMRFCEAIMECDNLEVKGSQKPLIATTNNKSTFNELQLQDIFNNAENSCKVFHNKIDKLKISKMSKSKCLKQLVKKTEEVINNHRSDLKEIIKSLSAKYLPYVDKQKKAEERTLSSTTIHCDLNIKKQDVAACNNEEDCIIIMDTKNKSCSATYSDNELSSLTDETMVEKAKTITGKDANVSCVPSKVAEKIKDKFALLQSSSDREINRDKTIKLHDTSCDPKLTLIESVQDTSKSTAKQDVNLDSDLNPNIESCVDGYGKSRKTDKMKSLKVSLVGSESKPGNEYNIENDPKLKIAPQIFLVDFNTVFNDRETDVTVNIDEGKDTKSKCDKVIKLCKFNHSKRQNAKRSFIKEQNYTVSQPIVVDLSSSNCSSSSSEEEEENVSLFVKKKNTKKPSIGGKEELIELIYSNSSCSSSVENGTLVQKKTKGTKRKNTDSSDDPPPRKKHKFQKLPQGSNFSDNGKKQSVQKERKIYKRVLSAGHNRKSNSTDNTTSTSECNRKVREEVNKRCKRIRRWGPRRRRRKRWNLSKGDKEKSNEVISQNDLGEAAKEAQLEEKEWKSRMEDKQRLCNKLVETAMDSKGISPKWFCW